MRASLVDIKVGISDSKTQVLPKNCPHLPAYCKFGQVMVLKLWCCVGFGGLCPKKPGPALWAWASIGFEIQIWAFARRVPTEFKSFLLHTQY